jgi:hypothetical protein
MKLNKTAILPIISVVCLGIGAITGHKIDEQLQDQIATWAATLIGVGISVWGVVKDHQKKGEEKDV